ncbi:MAG: HAMP domain-containing protein, partial [Defluviitaleaceae bacterium]|nr:HAMP domain-containing protein [Defluviitaleaceae bacterium]
MWSKLTLRMRITILTMFALLLVTASLTALSNHNAQRHFVIPLERLGLDESDIEITPRFDDVDEEITTSAFAINELTLIQDITRISQNDFRNYSMIIAIVFVLIGTALAYFISGQTLKPIKTLTEKIEEIDANNLGTQIEPPRSNDETARLTHTFNSML